MTTTPLQINTGVSDTVYFFKDLIFNGLPYNDSCLNNITHDIVNVALDYNVSAAAQKAETTSCNRNCMVDKLLSV